MGYKKRLKEQGFLSLDENQSFFAQGENISYIDGAENKIFEYLKNSPDEDLEKWKYLEDRIEDWPTKYHFAWDRVNLLKCLSFKDSDCVLELGGGTGILSEYIASKVEELVTIEGTRSRARSIAERCKGQKNVCTIVADFLEMNLIELFGEKSFDKIVLIGVLEYVPKFSKDKKDPINRLLTICNKLLKDNGDLIIAIENKIGLKYLLGWEEDHNHEKYYGPQSLYKKDETTTFFES